MNTNTTSKQEFIVSRVIIYKLCDKKSPKE